MDETNQNNQGDEDTSKLKDLESELESLSQKASSPSAQASRTPTTSQQPENIGDKPQPVSQPEPQPLPQHQQSEQKKVGKQGKILKTSLTILFITVFVAGLFALKDILFKKKVEPIPTPSPSPTQMPLDITESWLDYEDGVHFYKLKYPTDWNVTPTPEKGFGGMASFQGVISDGEVVKLEVGKKTDALERNETLEEFDKRITTESTPSATKRTKEVIEGRLNVYKQIFPLQGGDGTWSDGIYYLFSKDESVFFALAYTNNPDEDEPFFDKMVSTFRFKEEEKVVCPEQRPEACTEECLVGPPYICGSDEKKYCTTCKACSNEEVDFYTIQYEACGEE